MKGTPFIGLFCSPILCVATFPLQADPTITLNDPIGGAVLVCPVNFTLEAEASSPDGAVAEVEFLYWPFLKSPISLGVVTESPYRLEITNFCGEYGHIEAVVRDTVGGWAIDFFPLRFHGSNGDDLHWPIAVDATDVTIRTNNVHATKQVEEVLRFNLSPTPERTLWWSWIAPADGALDCSTLGSSFDARLILVLFWEPGIIELLAVSEKVTEHDFTRKVKLPVLGGREYLIGVSAWTETDHGLVTLQLAYEPIAAEPADPPANDSLDNRITLAGSNVATAGSNVGATSDYGDPTFSPYDLGGSRHSVWWGWTAPEAGPYWISTRGSDFDTRLFIALSQPDRVITILISDDESADTETSIVVLEAVQDQEYLIMVDGFGGGAGNIALNIEPARTAEPPANDAFENREMLLGSLCIARGVTYNATLQSGEPTNSLTSAIDGTHTIWYSWLATQDGWVEARAKPGRRTAFMGLTVHEGDSVDNLTFIAGSRYGTPLWQLTKWFALAGHTYHLQINPTEDTHCTVIVDATIEEELPRLRLSGTDDPGDVGLEISSLGSRRLQLEGSANLTSWQVLTEFWLEGATNLVVESASGTPAHFYRVLAH